jgi:hypothetical protein
MDRYTVCLSPEERNGLGQLLTAGKAAARRLTHVRILLLSDGEHRPDQEIVSAMGVGQRTVERARKRLVTEGFEAAVDPQAPAAPAGQDQNSWERRAEVDRAGLH